MTPCQPSHNQSDLALEELLSTLKLNNHHVKQQVIAQEQTFHPSQDQLNKMIKLVKLFMKLLWMEVMLLQIEETLLVTHILNHSQHNP
jgi:hypothetical protein